jgi:hypothetical protein
MQDPENELRRMGEPEVQSPRIFLPHAWVNMGNQHAERNVFWDQKQSNDFAW